MSEKLRTALGSGDHLAAANAIFDTVSGAYDQGDVDALHRVGRMSQAELTADPAPEPERSPSLVIVQTTTYGGRR